MRLSSWLLMRSDAQPAARLEALMFVPSIRLDDQIMTSSKDAAKPIRVIAPASLTELGHSQIRTCPNIAAASHRHPRPHRQPVRISPHERTFAERYTRTSATRTFSRPSHTTLLRQNTANARFATQNQQSPTHQTQQPQSWVRFTDPSLVPERSSLRLVSRNPTRKLV